MEMLVIALLVVIFALLSIAAGADSRPVDDSRPWWPGTRSDDRYTHGHA